MNKIPDNPRAPSARSMGVGGTGQTKAQWETPSQGRCSQEPRCVPTSHGICPSQQAPPTADESAIQFSALTSPSCPCFVCVRVCVAVPELKGLFELNGFLSTFKGDYELIPKTTGNTGVCQKYHPEVGKDFHRPMCKECYKNIQLLCDTYPTQPSCY